MCGVLGWEGNKAGKKGGSGEKGGMAREVWRQRQVWGGQGRRAGEGPSTVGSIRTSALTLSEPGAVEGF